MVAHRIEVLATDTGHVLQAEVDAGELRDQLLGGTDDLHVALG